MAYQDVNGKNGTVRHSPKGFACNMGWIVLRDGIEVYRGPRWQCHRVAKTGIPYVDQEVAHSEVLAA